MGTGPMHGTDAGGPIRPRRSRGGVGGEQSRPGGATNGPGCFGYVVAMWIVFWPINVGM